MSNIYNMTNFSITFNGETISGQTKQGLWNILKATGLTRKQFNAGIKNEVIPTYLVNKKTNEVTKLDARLDNRPLLKQQFKIAKKITNKVKSAKFADLNKDYKITSIMPKKSKVKILINIYIEFKISKDVRQTTFTRPYNGFNNKDSIDIFVDEEIDLYLDNIPGAELLVKKYDVVSKYTDVKMNFDGMILREQNILRIFNEDVENFVPPDGENCVKYYMNKKYKGLKKKVKSLPDEPTIDDLKKLCVASNICFRCYDINNKLVSSNIIKNTKTKIASLNIKAYNNHIYPVKNGFLNNKKREKNLDFEYEEDINTRLIKYLDEGKLPVYVSTAGNALLSYFITDTKQVISSNDEYLTCFNIAKIFGIHDKINYNTNITHIGTTISQLYVKENINSIWFNSMLYSKAGFNFCKDIEEHELNIQLDKIKTIDKNKCYSYILKELDYLIVVDMTKDEPITDFDNIVDHYMYIVQPEESTILLPNTNVYFGSLLKFAKQEKIKFKIIEGFETKTVPNYFKEMIVDLYKNVPEHAKNIVNRLIGTFNKGMTPPKDYIEFEKICNQDETDRSEGYVFPLCEKYNIMYSNKNQSPRLGTQKPIAFQILDAARIMMYNKMKELNLSDDQIIKVKTDSISFIHNDLDFGLDLDDDIDGWKEEEYKYMKYTNREDNDLELMTFKHKLCADNQVCKLITGNAGCGKSYDIMNKLVPSLNKSYLIVVPTNATMSEYKKNNFNVKVKQTFTFKDCIPEEDVIIVDEVGLSDYKDIKMIIKCILAGKNIYCYGDFTQLLPVGCDKQINTDYLINSMFNVITRLDTNFRNTFEAKFYDDLRYKYNQEKLINQVKKYSTDWKDAEYILTHRNETRIKYNKLKMEHLGLESICSPGCKVINKGDNIREQEIYKNFRFTVISSSDKSVCIKDEFKTYSIDKDIFMKDFQPSYSLTLYCIQGNSIVSFHYPEDDYKWINGRSAYTLISRLKF